MKSLTLILATFILVLVVKPGMDLLSLQTNKEQTCGGGKCTPTPDNDNSQDQNQDNDCDGKPCNPFQVCGSCVLHFLINPVLDISKPETSTKQNFTYQSIFTSQFALDFWHPPKIV